MTEEQFVKDYGETLSFFEAEGFLRIANIQDETSARRMYYPGKKLIIANGFPDSFRDLYLFYHERHRVVFWLEDKSRSMRYPRGIFSGRCEDFALTEYKNNNVARIHARMKEFLSFLHEKLQGYLDAERNHSTRPSH
jgi:hypothetical protein